MEKQEAYSESPLNLSSLSLSFSSHSYNSRMAEGVQSNKEWRRSVDEFIAESKEQSDRFRLELNTIKEMLTGLPLTIQKNQTQTQTVEGGGAGNHFTGAAAYGGGGYSWELENDELPEGWMKETAAGKLGYSSRLYSSTPFSGEEDVDGWILCCEQLFEIEHVSEVLKVPIASMHLEQDALQWHQSYLKLRGSNTPLLWNEYVEAIRSRFGSAYAYHHALAELMALKQEGSVSQYTKQFNTLLNKVNLLAKNSTDHRSKGILARPESEGSATVLPDGDEDGDGDGDGDTLLNSPNVLSVNSGLQVTGHVGKKSLQMLISSGTTHIFLDEQVAKKLGCKVERIGGAFVRVGNGTVLKSQAVCKNFTWRIHEAVFKADVYLVPLGGSDMVLGAQWLSALGVFCIDFKKMEMSFKYQGRKILLRGKEEVNNGGGCVDYETQPRLGYLELIGVE